MLRQSAEAGVARATYCNFWYAPWDLLCVPAGGAREAAVNTGWNALMDASYVDISMQLSFSRFRQFFTKPPVVRVRGRVRVGVRARARARVRVRARVNSS